jgi:2'-5' RNA ligase
MTDDKALTLEQSKLIDEKLGIDNDKIGCIMLDVEPLEVTRYVPDSADDLYISTSPDHKYVNGAVGEQTAHVTLLYGLCKFVPGFTTVEEFKELVDIALDGWKVEDVTIATITQFESHDPNEDYWCIVGELEITEELLMGNIKLKALPNTQDFISYRPHITLAYIKKDDDTLDKWITHLDNWYRGRKLKVTGINYGD